MNDTLSTLKAAEAAGATIQAYTCADLDEGGQTPIEHCGAGYWRDLEGPVKWSCHPSRYRVKVEGGA